MLDRLENELNKWLKKLEAFLDEIKNRKITSDFFEKKSRKLKHPNKERRKIIARREKMKEIMRLKSK